MRNKDIFAISIVYIYCTLAFINGKIEFHIKIHDTTSFTHKLVYRNYISVQKNRLRYRGSWKLMFMLIDSNNKYLIEYYSDSGEKYA